MRTDLQHVVRTADDVPLALRWIEGLIRRGLPGGDVWLHVGREKRSDEQNRRMWACLTDLSSQVDWYGQKLTPEEWKDVMTAGLKKQKAVPGIDGGFVVLGAHTSRMTKAEMSELIELILAFGVEQGVSWSEPEAA